MPEYHDAVASAPRPAAGPIADVLALYSPRPGENRSYAERRAAALSAVMGQIRNASPGYQDHVMEALNVPALLSQGLIQRPARVLAVQNADGTAAKSHYVQAIRADARLASRLMRRCSEANPAAEGESLDAHFERVAGWDFDRGFDDCEYPHLQAASVAAAQNDALRGNDDGHDSDGLVDEERVQSENVALIEQALELAYRSEERFFGWNQSQNAAPSEMVAPALSGLEEESIDPQALLLALGDRGGHTDDETSTDASQSIDRPRGA